MQCQKNSSCSLIKSQCKTHFHESNLVRQRQFYQLQLIKSCTTFIRNTALTITRNSFPVRKFYRMAWILGRFIPFIIYINRWISTFICCYMWQCAREIRVEINIGNKGSHTVWTFVSLSVVWSFHRLQLEANGLIHEFNNRSIW